MENAAADRVAAGTAESVSVVGGKVRPPALNSTF